MANTLYKKLDKDTYAYYLDAGRRKYCINNENTRKLRKQLRKQLRKHLNNFYMKEGSK